MAASKKSAAQAISCWTWFRAALGGTDNSQQAVQLDLIRESVASEEPGGGHMVKLLRTLLNSPLVAENRC
jgi:hypothetical protein